MNVMSHGHVERLVPGPARSVRESSFALVTNGYADGPAQAMRDHLINEKARRVVMVNHPLSREEGRAHTVSEWIDGGAVSTRKIRLPLGPPASYPLDIVSPLSLPRVDCWFGFNPLNVAHGLLARRLGRAKRVVYWGVDFVDSRFGRGPVTAVYEAAEGLACRRADARFELSAAMRDARDRRHGRTAARLAPSRIVPMGAWLDRIPAADAESFSRRRVVFLGHLEPRQGVRPLIDAVELVRQRGVELHLDVIGHGSQERELRDRVSELGLADVTTFHGFVEDHRRLEALVGGGSIGAAPYATGAEASFTAFADPGKLKIYLGAGLPIVTTGTAPVAGELERAGAATIVEFSAPAIASALERLATDEAQWQGMHAAALALARTYDWNVILPAALCALGFEP